jgi:hypothetical protein
MGSTTDEDSRESVQQNITHGGKCYLIPARSGGESAIVRVRKFVTRWKVM